MTNSGGSAPDGPDDSCQDDPSPPAAATSAGPPLPRRIGGIKPSATPAHRAQWLASPELLRRVIEGLRQL